MMLLVWLTLTILRRSLVRQLLLLIGWLLLILLLIWLPLTILCGSWLWRSLLGWLTILKKKRFIMQMILYFTKY